MHRLLKCSGMKRLFMILMAFTAIIAAGIALPACNVTRVVTNESSYFQRGDTSVMIQTKIIESYDASKKK